MPDHLAEGAVYRIDMGDGKPSHYWIILCAPRPVDGTFLAISLTDRHNAPWNRDVWPTFSELTETVRLAKPSVVAVRYAVIGDRAWLAARKREFCGICPADVLARARCNLFWYESYLRPPIKSYRNWFGESWSSPCGSEP